MCAKHSKHQPGQNNQSASRILNGGFLLDRVYSFKTFLQRKPHARPGICTVAVGLSLVIASVLLLIVTSRNVVAVSVALLGSLVVLVGVAQIFLFFRRGSSSLDCASQNCGLKENCVFSSASRRYGDAENVVCTEACSIDDVKNHDASQENCDVMKGVEIFRRFRDPLVLRTPTSINFKCQLEFPANIVLSFPPKCEYESRSLQGRKNFTWKNRGIDFYFDKELQT